MDYPLPDSSFLLQGAPQASWPPSQIQTLPGLMNETTHDSFLQIPLFLQSQADCNAPSASAAHSTSTEILSFGHDGPGGQMAVAPLQRQETPTAEFNQIEEPTPFDDDNDDTFGVQAVDSLPLGPLPRPRKRKAPTLRDEDWAPVKRRVIQLHIDKNIPLPEVKKQVEKEFKSTGFTATIRQYRSRLSQWGVDKNVKPNEMKFIVRKRQRRMQLEKGKGELMFRLRGSVVEPHKIDRWMKRNGIAQNAAFSPNSMASTPSALSMFTHSEPGTPKDVAMSPIAPPSSIRMDGAPSVANHPAITRQIINTNTGFCVFTTPEYRLQTQLFRNLPLFHLLVSMENPIDSPGTVGHPSLRSDTLLRTVTEIYAGRSNYPSIDSLIPYLALKDTLNSEGTVGFQQIDQMGILPFIYLISNNFPADAQRDSIYQLVKGQTHFIRSVFRILKGPSVDSLLENLFALAIEAEDIQMVKTLIKTGANVNANNCIFDDVPIPMTPLQFASLKNNAALVRDLVEAGSEIDAPESRWKCSPILFALYGHEYLVRWDEGAESPKPVDYERLFDVMQKLHDGGARVNNRGKILENETTESIRQWRSNIDPVNGLYGLLVEEHSPLTLASQFRYHRAVDFLLEKGSDPRFSMDGRSSALRQCLYDIPPDFEGTPKKLVDLCSGQEESEVRSTIVSTARSLIRAGTELNDHAVDECDNKWCGHLRLQCYSTLDLAILVGDLELVDEMLRADAEPTYHSLDLAIEIRSFDLFSKLLAKGAAIPNWEFTEDYSSSSDDVDAELEKSKFPEIQKRRALVLAAIRLGATSELRGICSVIESMGGLGNLLDDCIGLTLAIQDCCIHGHLETLQYLLASNIMPNPRPHGLFGRSVLLSIRHGHDLLDLLIENNADLNVVESLSWNRRELPLSLAILNKDLKTVRKLIRAGASVEDGPQGVFWGNFGNMLVLSIETGNAAIVEEVLGACNDINGVGRMDYGLGYNAPYCTPLTMAIKKRNWMLVDILRRSGAKVNHPDQNPQCTRPGIHFTALWAATSQKNFDLVESLIESGALIDDRWALEAALDDVNLLSLFINKLGAGPPVNKKSHALHFALRKSVSQRSISKVKLILDSGLIDLNSIQGGETLNTVLGYLEGTGVNHTILNMLLTARANPNVFLFHGMTAIHRAIERSDARSAQMILDAGAKVDPPFHPTVHYSQAQMAATYDNIEVLQVLLAHGCDPNAVAPGGQCKKMQPPSGIGTALQCATIRKNFEAVQLLLMKGADSNAVTKKAPHTALQIACRDGSKHIAELLITEGADVNAPPARKFGATALQFAALSGYLGIAHLLVENGANVNAAAAPVDGRTALEGAAEHGRIDMVQFLIDAGADLTGDGNKDEQYERALEMAYNNGHYATHLLLLSYHS